MDNRTIAAIATPIGPGGIGIIRISGPQALPVLKKLFISPSDLKKSKEITFISHKVYYGHLKEPNNDEIIDEVLVFYMAAPNSYTKDDVVEIQSHSGYIVLEKILSTILQLGVDIAKPGEFTLNAFLNGRIDLSQAEALIDLINAPSKVAATIAAQQMYGGIGHKICELINLVDTLYAKAEASIEFDESDNLSISRDIANIQKTMNGEFLSKIRSLIQSQKEKSIYFEGLMLAIVGSPNVGKSSLLNRMVEEEIAIVSEFPGTTRDIIREHLTIKGIPVTLCDTAGLHDTNDPIESIGIERTHKHIDQADVLLFVVEACRILNSFELFFLSNCQHKKIIVVINKSDISEKDVLDHIKNTLQIFPFVEISAKTGTGIDNLINIIFSNLVMETNSDSLSSVSPTLRQRIILEQIEKIIISQPPNQKMHELVTEDLSNIRGLLREITGESNNSEIYDAIFSQFCIGK